MSLDVIVGGQFGSESKGRVTADIAQRRRQDNNLVIGVRVAGPNAGHVVIDEQGRRFALRQLPVTMVSVPDSIGVIAAGSEIDPQVLADEIDQLEQAGYTVRQRLFIDSQATVLTAEHRQREGGNDGPLQTRIGSTGKGIGAARADRVMRTANIARDYYADSYSYNALLQDTAEFLDDALMNGDAVTVEGTQGYGLGLHAGYYPYCTSSDCRAIDFLAMAGIAPWTYSAAPNVWVVLRPYPIRVAGNSGPLLGETTWEALGLPEERTTVTQKVRRVGGWDPLLAWRAVRANGGRHARVALAMADQVVPDVAGLTRMVANRDLEALIEKVETDAGARVWTIGTGPRTTIWR